MYCILQSSSRHGSRLVRDLKLGKVAAFGGVQGPSKSRTSNDVDGEDFLPLSIRPLALFSTSNRSADVSRPSYDGLRDTCSLCSIGVFAPLEDVQPTPFSRASYDAFEGSVVYPSPIVLSLGSETSVVPPRGILASPELFSGCRPLSLRSYSSLVVPLAHSSTPAPRPTPSLSFIASSLRSSARSAHSPHLNLPQGRHPTLLLRLRLDGVQSGSSQGSCKHGRVRCRWADVFSRKPPE